ncbi:MAG TPA: FHA domain-containing protein [Gemmataceae bacterium]|jgi:predicted component of type VI protein secretion system|nr:FHA domain-containing protein [Gemmataceae bacterium]
MRAQLVPLDGGADSIEIDKDLTLVGRKEDCDLRLDHKSVSKMHCIIVKTDGLLLVRDLGSTNGTRVNGQRVRRAALLPNDQLTIARFKYRVHLGQAEAPIAPSDHTQQLEAGEVVKLLQKANPPAAVAHSPGSSSPPLQPNPLPDVYPDDSGEPLE